MVLQAAGFAHCDYRILRQLCTTTSIWTVDLAHLLRRFGMRVSFYTVTLGPNPAYANESFYMENMEDDERRVSQLFVEAAHVGIAIEQRSVSSEELQSWMLSGGCLIIVLVDKRKLDPWLGAGEPGSSGGMGGMSMSMCLPAVLCGMELGYAGHYVLLVGFDAATQEYTIRDPAAQVHTLRVTAAALDAARRSFGTDEDILVVSTAAGVGGDSTSSGSSSSCCSSSVASYSGVPPATGSGIGCGAPSGLQQLLLPQAHGGCHPMQHQELLLPLGLHQQQHHSHHHHHHHHMPRPVATQQTAAGLHAG
ncbi:hypothetical protein HYH02_005594 [Chlamydomonas schloesseri]|uniref:Uncharacterized protein n=1 Tax=Chlamydomonas schloesseri TaxID=2026947 RepID=A0A835WL85_9CHLO|nr:hypothetical protein HYH02_005594 [Chlamydomonas schloesseri]|eukprot:KAG2449447.1 hypothetical protein HYH02_005594 [Chlamydomonas schloesseri]